MNILFRIILAGLFALVLVQTLFPKLVPTLRRSAVTFCRTAFGCPPVFNLANVAEGEHLDGKISYYADAVIANRFLLAKQGSDSLHIATTALASDQPLGINYDSADAIGDLVVVELLGAAKGTKRATCSGAITAGQDIYTDVNGQVQAEPVAAGAYWLIGRAVTTTVSAGDIVEFSPTKAIRVIVLAAPTQTASGTIAGLHSTAGAPTKADFDALLAEAGKLQNDFYLLRAGLVSPTLPKML
ncbi:MAG TPA: DUF2190 family protein [Opitutaceae bacterium]|nr:DUF2190 family protein [Opitutaceae bacterium]